MTGPASFARDVDVATRARALLDRGAEHAALVEAGQRALVATLVEMWPVSAWRAAGAVSAKAWLIACTALSPEDAGVLERAARVCARDPRLATAVADGTLSVGRAARLGRLVTDERAPYLAEMIDSLLDLVRGGVADDQYQTVLAHWAELVDQELAPRRVQPHSLVLSEGLFGGGELHASLGPAAFQNVARGIESMTQDPDPADAPYQRTLSERRADALDDAMLFVRTHRCDAVDAGCDLDDEDDEIIADDTFDDTFPGDTLDEALDPANHGLDELDLIRARLRKAADHQRRRRRRQTRPRSDSRVNVHIDLRTLAGQRDRNHFEDLVLHGDGWRMTRSVAEQLLCDTALVATLFDGNRVLDATTDTERFSPRQRRAIAARDRRCIFPSCTRPPRHCDIHHLHHREHGGPTTVANGALLCRFHHRLIHQHRWTLRQSDDGTWVATDPHGTEWRGPAGRHRPDHSEAA